MQVLSLPFQPNEHALNIEAMSMWFKCYRLSIFSFFNENNLFSFVTFVCLPLISFVLNFITSGQLSDPACYIYVLIFVLPRFELSLKYRDNNRLGQFNIFKLSFSKCDIIEVWYYWYDMLYAMLWYDILYDMSRNNDQIAQRRQRRKIYSQSKALDSHFGHVKRSGVTRNSGAPGQNI